MNSEAEKEDLGEQSIGRIDMEQIFGGTLFLYMYIYICICIYIYIMYYLVGSLEFGT